MIVPGIIIPHLTVFKEDERIDESATADHVEWLIANGAHGVAPGGSSGEIVSLSLEEAKRLTDIAIQTAAGRVPVYPATGRYSTRDTIELSQYAERAGAKGVLTVLPYYMLPDTRSVMDHFRRLHQAISIPIILYNNPWTCGIQLLPPQIAQLVEEGVVAGVKASQGDPYRVNELRQLCGDKARLFYGHDYAPLEALLAGADGWLTGILNVFPRLAVDLWQAAAVEKNVERATAIWKKIAAYVYYSMNEKTDGAPHLIVIYKEALGILGRKVGKPRLPLQPMQPEQRKRLEEVLKLASA